MTVRAFSARARAAEKQTSRDEDSVGGPDYAASAARAVERLRAAVEASA